MALSYPPRNISHIDSKRCHCHSLLFTFNTVTISASLNLTFVEMTTKFLNFTTSVVNQMNKLTRCEIRTSNT